MSIAGRLRRWAEGYTKEGRFSPVGVVFHWVMAALVLFQIGLGWAMNLAVPAGGEKIFWFEVHSGIGLVIFVLAFFRMVWRAMVSSPFNDADTQGWKTIAAFVVERTFYVCFFLLPITGWVMWSAFAPPGPLSVAGFIPWPQLPFEEVPLEMRWQIMGIAESVHLLLVWVLMILVPVHVAAALKHHFWDRHDVLTGMLPDVPDWEDPRAGSTHKPTGARLPKESEAG